MSVREFDGVDDRIVLGSLGVPLANGAYSIVALVKPLDVNSPRIICGLNSSGALVGSLGESGGGTLGDFTATQVANAVFATYTVNAWNIAAVTKEAGNQPTRFHRKVLGSGSWQHADGDAIDSIAGVVDQVVAGAGGSGGTNPKNCRLAALFIFDTALADADLESIQTLPTSQFVADLGAMAGWEFNQASTGTAVLDAIGNADQTAITGTTVVSGDDPSGWTFGITVIPPLDFSLVLSGGASNTNPVSSIGGARGAAAPGADLFDDVSNAERIAGLVDYRLIYVVNDDSEDGSVIAWIDTQLEVGRQIAIGVPTETAGSDVTAIANDHTAPSSVVFSAPGPPPAGVSLGTIPVGSYRGLWLRRTVNSNTPADPTNFATVKLEVSRTS